MQDFFIQLAEALPHLAFPIAFLSPILGGEFGVMAVAFVAAQGFFPIWIVTIGSTLGMLVVDSIWFFVARTWYFERVKRKIIRNTGNTAELEEKIEHITRGRDVLILLISKMLIGTRILIILYISHKKISYGKFLAVNAPATFIWAVMLAVLGYAAGVISQDLFRTYEQIGIAVTFTVFFAAFVYIALYSFRTWITKKENHLK